MKIQHKHYKEYEWLLERRAMNPEKISIILPARNEHNTIAKYLPTMAKLFELGHIHEIILADSSDNSRTINKFLKSAMETKQFASRIKTAIKNNKDNPIKAINVFDPRFSKIYGDKIANPEKAPGKGRTMYLGMSIATGSKYIFLDTDFHNIHHRFTTGLIGPLQDKSAVFVKSTFELEDEWQSVIDHCTQNNTDSTTCDLLLKSSFSRTVAKPFMTILDKEFKTHNSISEFDGPLSGGYGGNARDWKSMKIPTRYGVEVYTLMQFIKKYQNGHPAYNVNLGIVDQNSVNPIGREKLGKDILGAMFKCLREENPQLFKQLKNNIPVLKEIYQKYASELIAHKTDKERIDTFSNILQTMLETEHEIDNTTILPALNDNPYYINNQEEIVSMANKVTKERLEVLDLIETPTKINMTTNTRIKELEKKSTTTELITAQYP